MRRSSDLSPRFLLVVQIIVWLVVAIVFAFSIDLARGNEIRPTCPSVLSALTNQEHGFPFNLLGLAEGLIAIGFLWFLTGLLAGLYSRFPRFFLSIRVRIGRTFGPSARRAGPLVMAAGVILLLVLQIGCEVSG